MPVQILVADDSVTMRRIMEITFAGEDAQVVTVDSGDACVARARELRPDVVFADASMPGMDGYAVASAIKGTSGLEGTAVIVMASQKSPYDAGRGAAAGVDDHILKPFDTQHVIDRVSQVMSKPRAAAPAAVAAPPAAPQRQSPNKTIAFGRPAPPVPRGAATAPMPAPAAPAPAPKPAAAPVAVAPAAVAGAASAATASLAGKLDGLGLTGDQVAGVLAISREVIEQVVWEVVPDLAETIIKEEIRRLTQ